MVIPIYAGVWMAILILAGNLSFRHQQRYEWNIIFCDFLAAYYEIELPGYPSPEFIVLSKDTLRSWHTSVLIMLSWIFSSCDVDLKMGDLGISYWLLDIYLGQFLQIILLPSLQMNFRVFESWWTYVCIKNHIMLTTNILMVWMCLSCQTWGLLSNFNR